ncbi:ATP-binding protein [Tistrella sp. BH-R2-4]|uniref:histidine kinase n=1 Tax=Tistrella arctica TaxID=3133430 RepID=A0ABU9YQ03_9PROT
MFGRRGKVADWLARGLMGLGAVVVVMAAAVGVDLVMPSQGMLAMMLVVLGMTIVGLAALVRRERLRALRNLARAVDAEQVRRTSEARLLDALNSMSDALLLCGPDDTYVISNRRYEEMLGQGSMRLAGGVAFDVLMRDALDRGVIDMMGEPAEDWLRRRLEMRRHGGGRFEFRMADGRWLMVREFPTHDGGLLSLYSDVTTVKAREAALAAARDTAERANKVKNDFLANVSHELRTPLNAVIGFTDMLLMGYAGAVSDRQREYLGDIRDSATHLLSVINDILDLSRAEAATLALDPRPLDLARLLRTAVRMLEPKAAEGQLAMTLDVEPPSLRIVADELRIRQVVVNLLSNAIKFTHPGGRITVTACPVAIAPAAIDPALCPPQSHRPAPLPLPAAAVPSISAADAGAAGVRIVIADDGIGMSPADVERAFEPFVQLDAGFSRRFEGTGLGLPLARRLVEAHGGRLDLDSRVGGGTRALITLPATGGTKK